MTQAATFAGTVALAVVLGFACPAAASDDPFAAALAAAAAGNHGRAAALFHDLAQQGDGTAAYNLAVLFASGNGVPQNNELALYWAWRARLDDIDLAKDLVMRLTPRVDPLRHTAIADRLVDAITPQATSGDGAAMLQLAAVLAHIHPKPDLIAAYGWQALAAMLDVPGSVAARNATLALIAPTDRAAAEQAALQQATTWCTQKRAAQDPAPPACDVLTELSG